MTTSPIGPALRRAWVGYQRRLNDAMAEAGFADRAFPDGRVLRMCSAAGGLTISQIGRQLDVTRQGAAKMVSKLRDKGYVTVADSPVDGREKNVTLTPRAVEYLGAQRRAAQDIERNVRRELGPDGLDALEVLVAFLAGDDDQRLTTFFREMTPLRRGWDPEAECGGG